jgi:hypothetical protein
VRLVFVADVLPTELRRIVEFLNEQTDPMEVLAVEVRRYEGEGVTTLVPRVIGQTVEAGARKSGRLPKRQWDEVSFFAALEERGGSGAVELARRVFEWAGRQGLRMAYGEGAKSGSCYPMLDLDGVNHYTISMWTYLKIQIQLGNMASAGLFESEVKRVELVERLNAIDGVHIPVDAIDRWPSVGMDDLAAADSLGDFLEVFDWYLDEIKSSWQPG